jgi:hypothetical protein
MGSLFSLRRGSPNCSHGSEPTVQCHVVIHVAKTSAGTGKASPRTAVGQVKHRVTTADIKAFRPRPTGRKFFATYLVGLGDVEFADINWAVGSMGRADHCFGGGNSGKNRMPRKSSLTQRFNVT